MSVKVRLQGTLYAILIVILAVAIPTIFGLSTLGVGVAFFGTVFMLVNIIADWFINDPIATKLLARPMASKFFHGIYGVIPPARRDWLAMKVCQRVVTDKLKALKETRNNLYKEENERISVQLNPEEVEKRVAENRELHGRVEVASNAYDEAKWLAGFFGFDTYPS